MSNFYLKKIIFHIKLLKNGFVANDKWGQVPGFDMLHQVMNQTCTELHCRSFTRAQHKIQD